MQKYLEQSGHLILDRWTKFLETGGLDVFIQPGLVFAFVDLINVIPSFLAVKRYFAHG